MSFEVWYLHTLDFGGCSPFGGLLFAWLLVLLSSLVTPPLEKFHGASSFLRPPGFLLLFPSCNSRCKEVVEFVVS